MKKELIKKDEVIENEDEFIFKFITPEEGDKIIKAAIDRNRNRTKGKSAKVVCWKEFEIMVRRQAIIDLLRQGLSPWRVFEEIMNRWGCGRTAAGKYFDDATNFMTETREDYVNHSREVMLERLEGLLEECIKLGDLKTASKYTDQLNKISGLYTEYINANLAGEIKFEFDK